MSTWRRNNMQKKNKRLKKKRVEGLVRMSGNLGFKDRLRELYDEDRLQFNDIIRDWFADEMRRDGP